MHASRWSWAVSASSLVSSQRDRHVETNQRVIEAEPGTWVTGAVLIQLPWPSEEWTERTWKYHQGGGQTEDASRGCFTGGGGFNCMIDLVHVFTDLGS